MCRDLSFAGIFLSIWMALSSDTPFPQGCPVQWHQIHTQLAMQQHCVRSDLLLSFVPLDLPLVILVTAGVNVLYQKLWFFRV